MIPGLTARLAIAVAIAVLLAGCGSSQSPAPSNGTATAEGQANLAELVVGCWSIEAVECRFVAQQALATVPADRGAPFAIEIQLYGCANGPCPPSLGAREGKVTIEYADPGEPIELSVVGPPAAPRFGAVESAWSGLLVARSARVNGPGPFPFELGHCGLSWQVDFDGSFWLPVGQVDGDASGLINAERGQIVLLGPNLAQYRGESGFTAQLVRFPGPKRVWLCR